MSFLSIPIHALSHKDIWAINAELQPSKAARPLLSGLLLALLCLVALAACDGDGDEELVVFAAASLTDVLTELGEDYEVETGTKVLFNFGASQQLARQIIDGAPADLLVSAGRQPVDLLIGRDGLASEPIDLLGNELVVVARRDFARPPDELAGLASGSVASVSIPDPDLSPAGNYAREAIRSLGLWEELSDKMVPTADVRAALTNVERGNTDLAIVYRTDALSGEGLVILDIVDAGSHSPIVYPIALTARGERAEAARRFASYLSGTRAESAFSRYGFSRPPAGPQG